MFPGVPGYPEIFNTSYPAEYAQALDKTENKRRLEWSGKAPSRNRRM